MDFFVDESDSQISSEPYRSTHDPVWLEWRFKFLTDFDSLFAIGNYIPEIRRVAGRNDLPVFTRLFNSTGDL